MEQSPSKRRKLSPSTSVAATTANTNARPTSRDSAPGSGYRASFLSPTKASLARFNPGLLPRAQSSEPRRPASRKSPVARTRASNATNEEDAVKGATGARTGSEPPETAAESNGLARGEGVRTPRNGLSAAPRRPSRTPNAQHSPPKLPQTQPAHELRVLPSRVTGTAPQLGRNIPGTGTEVPTQGDKLRNGVIIDESSMEKLPRTPTRHGVPAGAGRPEGSEPSLPSTPSQLGLEALSERPQGLLFGSPSKRTRKQTKGPSPLKPKDGPPKQPPVERPLASSLGQKVFLADLPKPAPSPEQAQLQEKKDMRVQCEREVLKLGSGVLEGALLSTWQRPATKERAGQLKQRKKLTEVSNKLLRLRDDIEQLEALLEGSDDTTQLDQTVRHSDQSSSNILPSRPNSFPQRLSLYFPFSSSDNNNENDNNVPPPGTTSEPATSGNLSPETTLKITNSALQQEEPTPTYPLLQTHDIDFTSAGTTPTTLRLTINTAPFELHNIRILNPSPASPTTTVLENWIRTHATNLKDVSTIGTALHHSTHLARLRTQCWRTCHDRFPDLTDPGPSLQDRDTIVFHRNPVSLAISWHIALTDSGEPASRLAVDTTFPPAWLEDGTMSGREVEEVREAFELLVRERGVTEAVAVTVKLLFPPVD